MDFKKYRTIPTEYKGIKVTLDNITEACIYLTEFNFNPVIKEIKETIKSPSNDVLQVIDTICIIGTDLDGNPFTIKIGDFVLESQDGQCYLVEKEQMEGFMELPS